MDNFLGWFVLIFYVLPIVLILPLIKKRSHIIGGLMDRQALKRNGTVKKILGIPYFMQFSLEGRPVALTLSHGGKNSPPTTSVMAELNHLNDFQISIGPEYYLNKFAKKFGGQDIQLMNPEFDDAFLIKGSDENRVRSFLDHDVQKIIMEWKESRPYFSIAKNKFRFTIHEVLKEDESLDEFINSAILLFQKAQQLG